MAIFLRLVPISKIIGLDHFNHKWDKWINCILRGITFLLLSCGTVASLYYLIFDASTFIELSASYTVANMMLYGVSAYFVLCRRWEMMRQMIESIRSTICERQ